MCSHIFYAGYNRSHLWVLKSLSINQYIVSGQHPERAQKIPDCPEMSMTGAWALTLGHHGTFASSGTGDFLTPPAHCFLCGCRDIHYPTTSPSLTKGHVPAAGSRARPLPTLGLTCPLGCWGLPWSPLTLWLWPFLTYSTPTARVPSNSTLLTSVRDSALRLGRLSAGCR